MTLRSKTPLFLNYLRNRWKALVIPGTLFLTFLSFYLWTSFTLSQTGAFNVNEVLFGMDMQRIVNDITQFNANHFRTTVHPLFMIFFNPAGEILQRLTNSDISTAIILNSLFGAAGVCLAYCVFFLIMKNNRRAVLFAVIYGVSAGQLFHAVIPETYAFSGFSLLCTWYLFIWSIREKKIILPLWILCGIFSIGVTTTNIIQTLICLIVACGFVHGFKPARTVISKAVFFLLCTVGIAIILSMIQRIIYPMTNPFFIPGAYKEEFNYVSLTILRDPVLVLNHLARVMLLVSYMAPIPGTFLLPEVKTPIVSLESSVSFTPAGLAAVILWSGILVGAIFSTLRKATRNRPFTWNETAYQAGGFLLCLLFNVSLHVFYGVPQIGPVQFFLYSGNFVFLLPGILAIMMRRNNTWVDIPLAALALCMLVNNMQVIFDVINLLTAG
jgi:hypothetical protein